MEKPARSDQEKLDSLKRTVKLEIQSLLCTEKDPISTRELLKQYYNEMGTQLPYPKLGYQSVEALLLDMRDIIICSRGMDGELKMKALPQAASHIADLVAGQRQKKKKRKTTFTSHYQNRSSTSYSRNSGYNASRATANYRPKPPSFRPSQHSNSYSYMTKPMNSIFKPMMSSSTSAVLSNLRPMMPQTGPQQQQKSLPSIIRIPPKPISSSSSSKVVFRPMLPAVEKTETVEKNGVTNREAIETNSKPTLDFRVMTPPTLPQTHNSNENSKRIAGPVFQSMDPYPVIKPKPSIVFRPMQLGSPPAAKGEEKTTTAADLNKPPQLVQTPPALQSFPPTFCQPRPRLFRPMVQPLAQPTGMQMNGVRPSLVMISRCRSSPESQCPPVELNFQRLNISENGHRASHSKQTIVNEDILWVEKLKDIAQRNNLGQPQLKHSVLKTGRYLATITVAGESYLSYPQDFADLIDAYEEAARQACHQLLVRNVAAH